MDHRWGLSLNFGSTNGEKCVQGLGGRGVCEDQKDKSVPPKSNFWVTYTMCCEECGREVAAYFGESGRNDYTRG